MNDRLTFRLIFGVTAVVLVAVVLLHLVPKPATMPAFAAYLPGLNATLNGTCTALLLASFACIKNGKVTAHKRINIVAFALSTVFLLSYVAYHAVAPEAKFPAGNPWRPFYLTILISHICLAAVVLPLVQVSFYRGLNNQIAQHRRIVRWAFPIWLYVTITGVLVYVMISPYYRF